MDHLFFDRVNGSFRSLPIDNFIIGQLQYRGEKGAVFFNTIPPNIGEFAVPDTELNILITQSTTNKNFERSFDARLMLSESEALFLDTFQAIIPGGDAQISSWDGWENLPILDPNIKENIHIQDLDKKISEYLKHIQNVCKQPQTHLTTNLEKVLVSLARRFKSKTYSYLASHTEDWERRTLRSVYPKRILSTRTEELWIIYENIVAVRLVDRLLKYIKYRIQIVEETRVAIINANNFSTELAHNHYALRKRLSIIWGDMINPQWAIDQADWTLLYLNRLKTKIANLTDSTLYKQIPINKTVPSELRATNLLVYDEQYKFVAHLWREYDIWKSSVNPKRSPLRSYKYFQNICKTFTAYCATILYKSLIQLNFKADSTEVLAPDNIPIIFSNGIYKLELFWDQADILTIRYDGLALISFVPLPVHLCNLTSKEKIQDVIRSLAGNIPGANLLENKLLRYRVLLYYGSGNEIARFLEENQQKLYSFGGFASYGVNVLHGMLPISAIDLFSVERIGRAIRWVILENIFLSYPKKIRIPNSFSDEIKSQASHWLQIKDGFCEISEFASSEERKKILSQMKKIRNSVKKEKIKKRKNIKELDDFQNKLIDYLEETKMLYSCPMCKEETSHFSVRDQETFECHCKDQSCKAIWGIRRCLKCKERYPILLPGSLEDLPNMDSPSPGWIDKLLGEDVLSLPHPRTISNRVSFICPRCGTKEDS